MIYPTVQYLSETISSDWVAKHTSFLAEWKTTQFPYYPTLKLPDKGKLGEKLTKTLMKAVHNSKVKGRKNPGHDQIIDDWKTEIKLSIRLVPEFIYNHISVKKDYDRLLFLGIDAKTNIMYPYFMTKEDIINHLPNFSHQQGGVSVKNDDFLIVARPTFPFMRPISEW